MDESQISPTASSQPPPHQAEPPLTKRRPRRRWPYYIILLLIVLPFLGYALLPWLIPTGWLKRQIIAGIQTQFGRKASISSIKISWAEGIVVRDITIDHLEEFGPGHFFQASKLQLDFRPLHFLLGRQLGTIRVDQPSLWIVTDSTGKPNLISLPPPSETAGFDLITITNANLHFINQAHNREGLISIPLISVARDANTGRYLFRAEGELAKTTGQPSFSLQVSFTPPSKQPAVQETAVIGSAKLTWSDFDLATVPLPRFGRLDFQAIGGKTSGQAQLELYSDAHIELLECSASADNLYMQMVEFAEPPESGQPSVQPAEVRIPRAQFSLHGSYEFVSGELTVESLKGLLDGLEFNVSFQGRFSPTARALLPSAASLIATVQPSRLREQLPFLDQLLRKANLTVTGSSSLTLDFKQSERVDRLSLSVDALQMGLHVPNLLHKSMGSVCKIAFAAEIDHTTGLLTLAEPLQAELASGRFSLDMRLAQPVRMDSFLDLLTRPLEISELAVHQWVQTYFSASLDIQQISDFAAIFPTLAPVLARANLSGPIQAQFLLNPLEIQVDQHSSQQNLQSSQKAIGRSRTAISATISFPAQTSLELAPYFHKLPDIPLTLLFAGRLAEKDYQLEDLNISCRLGELDFSVANAFLALEPKLGETTQSATPLPEPDKPAAQLPNSLGALGSHMTLSDLVTSLSAAGEFQLKNPTSLPDAIAPLRGFRLAGDLSGRFDFRFIPAEVLSLTLALNATDLACEISGTGDKGTGSDLAASVLFQKPSGVPTELDLQFQADFQQSNGSKQRFSEGFGLSSPALTALPFQARIGWKFADSFGSLNVNHEKALHFDLRLSQLNLDTLSSHIPTLARAFEAYQLGGIAVLNLSGQLGPDLLPEELDIDGDFTDIHCTLRSVAADSTDQDAPLLQKMPGIPLSCLAHLAVDGPDDKGRRTVYLKSADVKFAASQLELKGSVLLTSSAELTCEGTRSRKYWSMESIQRLEPFVQTELTSNGQIVFDKDLFELLPSLADIDRKFGLNGTLNYNFSLAADTHQASLQATLSSGPGGLKLGPADFKRMEHRLDLFFRPADEGLTVSGASLDLPLLELNLLDQPLRLSGSLNLQAGKLIVPDLFIALGDSSAYCTARLQNIWTAPVGYVNLYSPLFDQPRLADLATRLISLVQQQRTSGNENAMLSPQSVVNPTSPDMIAAGPTDLSPTPAANTATAAESAPAAQMPPPAEMLSAERATEVLRLPPMDIIFRVQCDRFIFLDPFRSLKFNLERVDLDSQLTSSSLVARFTTAMNGGRIDNFLTISFDKPGLPLTYRYEALELMGDENTAPMVSQVFPDLTVTGTITETRTTTANILGRSEPAEFPMEQGRTVLRDGVLIGPSAPWWVTYWFSKLSLTKYYFDVADNVFSRDPKDGKMANDMVLVGKGRYNMYITGTTMADNTTDYTVGVDLSRFMTLEQRHNWRQFRVPLMTYTGQIADRKWARQTVNFTWPTRTAWEMLIENNALKTLIERYRRAD